MTAIEWATKTWNPVTGCTKVSPGCKYCYAERLAPYVYARQGWGFKLTLHPDRLDVPKHWRKPQRIFVCSMSDIFHKDIPDDFIDRIFLSMVECPQHTFLVLTKRSWRMRQYMRSRGWAMKLPPRNIWLGVSCEGEDYLPRLFNLIRTPAIRRFVSFEPLLARIASPKAQVLIEEMDWVIVGGESGPKARPMHRQWVGDIKDLCHHRQTWRAVQRIPRTAFFFKQWGGKTSKANGREFAGKVWDEIPPTGWPEYGVVPHHCNPAEFLLTKLQIERLEDY